MTDPTQTAVNVFDAIDTVPGPWDPHLIGSLNASDIVVIKIEGAMPFHSFPDFDDLFYVLRGEMVMEYEDRDPVPMKEGDLLIVPRGVSHRPSAEAECHLLVIERGLQSDDKSGGA